MPDTQRPQAYDGSEPYIFVSYAHRDGDTVFPFIAALQKRFNVWYDDGLHYGGAWEEEIGKRLEDCAVFLFVVTEASLESENCRDELHLAREGKKNFINILTDSALELPTWFRLRYLRYQACSLDAFPDDDAAVADLIRNCDWLAELERQRKRETAPERPADKTAPVQKPDDTYSGEAQQTFTDAYGENTFPRRELGKPAAPPASPEQDRRREIEAEIARLSDRLTFAPKPDGSYELALASEELEAVELPDFVSSVGERAFEKHENLKSVTLPDSVTEIGEDAFSGCRYLSHVRIGKGLKKVGRGAFLNCWYVETVVYAGSLEEWCAIDFQSSVFENASLSASASLCLNGSDVPLTSLALPDAVTSFGIAFGGCGSLTRVALGRGVTVIPNFAFEDCRNLRSVRIPDGVIALGSFAFSGCKSLASVKTPDSVTELGNCTFARCDSLADVTLGRGITEVGLGAFDACPKLQRIRIPEGVTGIGEEAFAESGLTEITLPASLKAVGEAAFRDCKALRTVNYRGTRLQWLRIAIKKGNTALKNAEICFKYSGY